MTFRDRHETGRRLAQELFSYEHVDNVIVLGLPRGGVPVAAEVAAAIGAPLDVFAVRKLGVPGHEELGMGAVASGGVQVLNPEVLRDPRISPESVERVSRREREEVERREQMYRADRAPIDVRGKTVVLVDDGLATGFTMKAAVAAVRKQDPHKVVVAVPVAAMQTVEELAADADEVICPLTPRRFLAVGLWYEDFRQLTDDEVRTLLDDAWRREQSAGEEAT